MRWSRSAKAWWNLHNLLENLSFRVFAILLLLWVPAIGTAQTTAEETIEPQVLRIAHALQDVDAVASFFLIPWAKKVEDQSGGALVIEYVPTSPERSAGDLALIETDEIEGAWLRLAELDDHFPAAETFELPFMASLNPVTNSVAAWRFSRNHIMPQREDLFFVTVHTFGAGMLHTKGRRIIDAGSFDGLKASAPTSSARDLIAQMGGTPTDMVFGDVAGAMQNGQIEGAIAPWHRFSHGPILKRASKHMMPGVNKAMMTEGYALVISRSALNRLPEDLRAIIEENSGEKIARLAGQAIAFGTEVGRANLIRSRRTQIVLTGDGLATLQDAARTVIASWLTNRTANGFPARLWLQDFSKHLADTR